MDNIPGVPIPPLAPPPSQGAFYFPADEVAGTIAHAHECYSDACRRIRAEIDECLAAPRSIYSNCVAILQGEIANRLDEIERVYLKYYYKVGLDARQSVDNAWSRANGAGIPTPTSLGLAAGKETGEYLAASYLRELDGEPVLLGYPTEVLGPNPFGIEIPGELPGTPAAPQTGWQQPNPDACNPPLQPWIDSLNAQGVIYYHLVADVPWVTPEAGWIHHPDCAYYAAPTAYTPDPSPNPSPNPPPTFPPPPPTFPPPPPPAPESCPVPPPAATQCQDETAWNGWGTKYDKLDPIKKRLVDQICACNEPPRPWKPSGTTPADDISAFKLPNWCSPKIVEELSNFTDITTDPATWLMGLLKLKRSTDDTLYVPEWLQWAADSKHVPWWPVVAVINGLIALIDGTKEAVRLSNDTLGEATTSNLFTETIYEVLSTLNKWVGFPPKSWLRSIERTINWQAPEEIPTVADAMDGYMGGAWAWERAEAYIRANNVCPEPMRELIESRRTRPNVGEVTRLYMEEKISKEEFEQRMGDLGVTDGKDMQKFVDLVDAYPQPPDLIRFMVRDATNADTVRKYGLLDGFDKAFDGQILKYARAVGLAPEEAKLYWAAHWEFPSNTQLYEMLHRLRPGAVPKEIEVKDTDVKEVLGINDIIPFWQDRLMAISYHPLTLTDIKELLFAGTLTDDKVVGALQDVGYNLKDATEKAKGLIRIKQNRQRSAAGLPSPKDYVSLYIEGTFSVENLTGALRQFGWSEDLIAKAVQAARDKRAVNLDRAILKGAKARYLSGASDRPDAEIELARNGWSPGEINYLMELWSQERGGKSKVITGSQLCRAFEMKLITAEQYQMRLYAAGYSVDDVKRIMAECGVDIGKRQMRAAEAAQRKAEAAASKQKREAEKAEREAKAAEKKRCRADKAKREGKAPPCD